MVKLDRIFFMGLVFLMWVSVTFLGYYYINFLNNSVILRMKQIEFESSSHRESDAIREASIRNLTTTTVSETTTESVKRDLNADNKSTALNSNIIL